MNSPTLDRLYKWLSHRKVPSLNELGSIRAPRVRSPGYSRPPESLPVGMRRSASSRTAGTRSQCSRRPNAQLPVEATLNRCWNCGHAFDGAGLADHIDVQDASSLASKSCLPARGGVSADLVLPKNIRKLTSQMGTLIADLTRSIESARREPSRRQADRKSHVHDQLQRLGRHHEEYVKELTSTWHESIGEHDAAARSQTALLDLTTKLNLLNFEGYANEMKVQDDIAALQQEIERLEPRRAHELPQEFSILPAAQVPVAVKLYRQQQLLQIYKRRLTEYQVGNARMAEIIDRFGSLDALLDTITRLREENAVLRSREVRFAHEPLLRRRPLKQCTATFLRCLVMALQNELSSRPSTMPLAEPPTLVDVDVLHSQLQEGGNGTEKGDVGDSMLKVDSKLRAIQERLLDTYRDVLPASNSPGFTSPVLWGRGDDLPLPQQILCVLQCMSDAAAMMQAGASTISDLKDLCNDLSSRLVVPQPKTANGRAQAAGDSESHTATVSPDQQ